jgi:DNA modification methylase
MRQGDVFDRLGEMEDESVHCVVTSPPYWGLRDYGVSGQLGLEPTPDEYVAKMVEVFREVRRVLQADGTLWLNLGDCYATGAGKVGTEPGGGAQGERWRGGHEGKHGTVGPMTQPNRMPIEGLKPKDLVGMPWRVAFALQADGWYLRSDIIWAKPNPMPESVRDRPTKAHEYVFLLTKSPRYFYDSEAVAEVSEGGFMRDGFRGGDGTRYTNNRSFDNSADAIAGGGAIEGGPTRNRRTVWTITTKPYPDAHFATFPPELPEICIKAGCPEGGVVLDPFAGSGTTLMVALRLGRDAIGIELNPEYVKLAEGRIDSDSPLFNREGGVT